MNILYLTPHVPGPTKVRSYNHIRGLQEIGSQVVVATLVRKSADAKRVQWLLDEGFRVLAVPLSPARIAWNALAGLLSHRPLQAGLLWSPALLEQVRRHLASNPIDIVHVEHLRMAAYGLHLRANWPVVWDAVDHLASLYEQAADSASLRWRIGAAVEAPRLRYYEKHLAHQFPMTLVISPYDQALFQQDSRVLERVQVAPLGIPLLAALSSSRDPFTLIITGTLNYHPNVASVLAFVRDIFPLVRQQVPEVRLQLVGANPDRAIRRLKGPAIEVTGYVLSVSDYLARATVAIAPVIYGSGTQVKVLEAFSAGTPLVATSVALRGLAVEHEKQALIADTSADFARQVIRLLGDGGLRERIGQAGRLYVEHHHNLRRTSENLIQLYEQARLSLSSPTHRQ